MPALAKLFSYQADSQTGVFHDVMQDVQLHSGPNIVSCDMTVLTDCNRSFIPISVALRLNPTIIGPVDLLMSDFPTLLALYTAQQDQTIQTVFFEVEIDAAKLPIGPSTGRVRVLVSDDLNSDYGVIGRDLLVAEPGMTFRRHDWKRATYLSYCADTPTNNGG